jgi:DNA-binding LacI/PurR family transcriptional regulator
MPRRITQEDVAKATGLSRSTVAKVLSLAPCRGELSAATRQRVLDAARDLGYRSSGQGVILVGADDSAWQDPFLPAALAALTADGHRASLVSWEGCAAALHTGPSPAAVVAVAFLPPTLPDLAAATGLRCLALNATGTAGAIGIRPDEEADATAAVEHLAALGHRSICFAFATGVHPHFSITERRRAIAAAARRLRITIDEVVLNHGEDELLRLMAARNGPTSLILAPVEAHPWRVMEARRTRAFALVVLGQDERNSPVTSVQPDYAGIAMHLAAACSGRLPEADLAVPGRLVERATSVGPPARA